MVVSWGRSSSRGELMYLQPGGHRDYGLEVGALVGKDEIHALLSRTSVVLAGVAR